MKGWRVEGVREEGWRKGGTVALIYSVCVYSGYVMMQRSLLGLHHRMIENLLTYMYMYMYTMYMYMYHYM